MKTVFINIKLTTMTMGKRLRVRPIEGQNIPIFWVSCSRSLRSQIPLGSIFCTDLKLIQSTNRKPYFVALKRDYNQLYLF